MTEEPVLQLDKTIISDIEKYRHDHELEVYVGGDSQVHNRTVTYVKVIVLRKVDCGAIGYYKIEKERYNRNIRERLWNEVYKIVDVAKWLDEILIAHSDKHGLDIMVKEVHADLNPSPKYKSNEVVQACLGYIQSMGYVGQIKPDAWATGVADKKSK
ncbi:MAG: ribonuclease H-like YkuK family protein [Lentisphaerota bacterium]